MADTEALVRVVATSLASEPVQRLLEGPFERISVADAFVRWGGTSSALDLAGSDEQRYFEILINLVEPALARCPRPVFLTHYPLRQSGLAQPCPDDPRCAQRYELYFRGLELCNGYTELTDATTQRQRFIMELARRADTGEPIYPIDENFLTALAHGVPACSGNALGFDRLVAALLEVDRLQSVSCFTDAER
jgi:lysyl-tRNA synthetase class 2